MVIVNILSVYLDIQFQAAAVNIIDYGIYIIFIIFNHTMYHMHHYAGIANTCLRGRCSRTYRHRCIIRKYRFSATTGMIINSFLKMTTTTSNGCGRFHCCGAICYFDDWSSACFKIYVTTSTILCIMSSSIVHDACMSFGVIFYST